MGHPGRRCHVGVEHFVFAFIDMRVAVLPEQRGGLLKQSAGDHCAVQKLIRNRNIRSDAGNQAVQGKLIQDKCRNAGF